MGGFFAKCSLCMQYSGKNNEYYCNSVNIQDYERAASLHIDSGVDW